MSAVSVLQLIPVEKVDQKNPEVGHLDERKQLVRWTSGKLVSWKTVCSLDYLPPEHSSI